MARTEGGAALTQAHRGAQLSLRAALLRDLLVLWRVVDPVDLAGTIGRFAGAAAVLVRARHRDSAGLAAGYLRRFREAEGIGGEAAPRMAESPLLGAVEGLVRGAGLSGIINARRAGFSPQAAARNGLVKVSGDAGRLMMSFRRQRHGGHLGGGGPSGAGVGAGDRQRPMSLLRDDRQPRAGVQASRVGRLRGAQPLLMHAGAAL